MSRSYLFVPGTAPDRMAKAAAGPADALILDLEDSVPPGRKDEALEAVCTFLQQAGEAGVSRFWVRINGTQPQRALREIASLPLAAIAGLMLPKLSGLDRLLPVAHALDALEARDGIAAGRIGLIGIVTETAASLLSGTDLGRGHPRLRGYCWGIEDLSAEIGRVERGAASGASRQLAALAQNFCLLVATAAKVDAIDAVETDFRDMEALAERARLGAELGFAGKLAIHPAQVAPINAAFTPDPPSIAWARAVLQLEAQDPGRSAFQLDGRMIDLPHMQAARRILARAGAAAS